MVLGILGSKDWFLAGMMNEATTQVPDIEAGIKIGTKVWYYLKFHYLPGWYIDRCTTTKGGWCWPQLTYTRTTLVSTLAISTHVHLPWTIY
jgi:hypothetical protein